MLRLTFAFMLALGSSALAQDLSGPALEEAFIKTCANSKAQEPACKCAFPKVQAAIKSDELLFNVLAWSVSMDRAKLIRDKYPEGWSATATTNYRNAEKAAKASCGAN